MRRGVNRVVDDVPVTSGSLMQGDAELGPLYHADHEVKKELEVWLMNLAPYTIS